MSRFMTDEAHIPEEEQESQDALPEVEAEAPVTVSASEDDAEPLDQPAPDTAEKPAAAFVFTDDDEDDEEPLELPAPAVVEAIELPAPEAEEVKAALRELRASAMRAATSGEGAPDLSEAPDERSWFVVHCYSGYENKVKHNLEQRIESMGMANQIFQVVVPTEEEIEVKEGKRRTIERRVFPGYILVQMLMNDDSWYVVRNTPGVTGFVGMGNKPTPLRQEEVQGIIKRMEAEAPKVKVTFKPGQKVRIVDGPFNDFMGTVDEINMDKAKVRVMVSFFGRETPVELDFLQVEKM
jgi:transcription termination/antitermination protein NusG